MRKTLPRGLLLSVVALLAPVPLAHEAPGAGHETPARQAAAALDARAAAGQLDPKVAREMAGAATKFFDALTDEQKATAGFEFTDNERLNWHFIPKPRKGLTLKDMKPEQRDLAMALLRTGLSDKGTKRLLTIMSLEMVLKDLEAGPPKTPVRDPEMYYWSLFGKPGAAAPWGWRVEGHHVSINFTIVADKGIAAGPLFMGDNPAEVKDGPHKGLRALAEEEDQGRTFVLSLTEAQRKKGVLGIPVPGDIVTRNNRQAVVDPKQGIPFGDLDDKQKAALTDLVGTYAHRLRPELAEQDLSRIARAGLDKIVFAWVGGFEKGQGHYYRILGPTFLIEYDNTQNNANHIHTVWRDLENDFGGDLLKRHLEESPHHKAAAKS